MATSEPQRLRVVRLAVDNYRPVVRGILVGSIAGLAFPSIARLLRSAGVRVAGVLANSVLWPSRKWLFLAVIISAAFILYLPTFFSFCKRLVASWRAEPSRGLFWIWLATAAIALGLLSRGRYGCTLLGLALSIGISALLVLIAAKYGIPKKPSDVDPDLPIESWAQDVLDRKSVVSRLVEQVTAGVASVIAVVGPYGDGKTSVLNLLKGALRSNHRDVVVVPFTSSLATSDQVLVATLFNSIAKELQKRFVYERLPEGFVRYASFLVGTVPRLGSTLKQLFRIPSQEDQIQQVKRSLEKLRVRVVVVVDDMDRMHEKELEVLLKLMRGACEFSNLTYVCAFDKEALVREFSGNRTPSEAATYLEKFFPLQIPLPKLDVTVLAHEFDKKFEALCKRYGLLSTEAEQKEFNENFGPLWQTHVNRCFSNLRRIKLFFNRVTTTIGSIAEEINPMDFMLLEIIRDTAPDIYEQIYVNRRYFFYGSWRIETWLETLHPDDEEEKNIRKQFLDELLQPLDGQRKELILKLLSALFPVVQEYRGKGLHAAPDPVQSKKERRIYHPAFFARYFIYGVQADQFGEAEFNRLVSELNKFTDIETCKRRVKQDFESLPAESRKRHNLLDQISIKIDLFGDLQAEAVGLAMAELSDRLEPPILGLAEAETARRVIFLVGNRFAGSGKVQDFLEKTIRSSTADYFAALILVGCEDPKQNQILTEWQNVNVDKLRYSFRQRMKQKYFSGGSASIFESANQKGALRSLGLWLKAGGSEEIRSYLTDEFARRSSSVGKLMNLTFPTEEAAILGQLEGLSKLYSLRELEALLDKSGWLAHSSAEEESAIARFRQILDAARMAKLRFKLAEGSVWSATNEDGSTLQFVNGQVVDNVKIADDGLPADQNFRDAVAAGIAEIMPPPSWIEAAEKSSKAAALGQ